MGDTGVGMTRQELVNNLGTVAHSGTKNFMNAMKSGADSRLIGQFGVGFYSAFLVAERVSVFSKHNEDIQHVWESKADGSFTVSATSTPDAPRGTKVVLQLKEDMGEYLDEHRLRALIRRHCSFVGFPIELFVTKMVDVDEGDRIEEVVTE